MLKSLNISVNNNCNHRCQMCNIWQNEKQADFTACAINEYLGKNPDGLKNVIDLSLTGGEPFLRKDIIEYTLAIIRHLPSLKILFINTNGSMPDRAAAFATAISTRVTKAIISVSIDGDPVQHRIVRGADAYDKAVLTIQEISNLKLPNVATMISTTLTDIKIAIPILEHISHLARQLGCDYTFRVAENSSTYYGNDGYKTAPYADEDLATLENFIKTNKPDDPFLPYVIRYLRTKKNDLMIADNRKNRCLAGEAFIFVQADGIVRPCIYSQRTMGLIKDGVRPERPADLGAQEPCPCCTECTVYPMLLARGHAHTKL